MVYRVQTVIYGILLFFDNFFKTCMHYPYIRFLEETGIQLKFFSVCWKTKAFNRSLIRWGNSNPRYLKIWFKIGTYVTFVLLPFSLVLLLYSILVNFSSTDSGSSQFVLQPVLPGINLPASELAYYSLTLILCTVVHELGHAIAAVLYDVNIIDVGANIVFVLPFAYVNLCTERFLALRPTHTLKILCAGVWHNIVLSVVALLLYFMLPTLFSVFFHLNSGVAITEIAKNSHLAGSKGLNIGDTVFQINECDVRDENSWYKCLAQTDILKPAFCIEPDLIHQYDESIPLKHIGEGHIECCESNKKENVCFEYLDPADGILELPSHVCLPARRVVERSEHFCSSTPYICPTNLYCFRPILANSTNLFKISTETKDVIYLGLVSDLYRTIHVSSYIPKYFFKTPTLPDAVTKFLKYVTIMSLGLAIINVLPCKFMDGQYITEMLALILFKSHFGESNVKLATSVVNVLFTIIIVCYCVYSLSKSLL
ncbi:unnamed protein product [Acanthoscelides obtectus]|uniref:Membrane-bound transcription factor site-2 protease n=1 Tax=Acanthoscelides obtectus TaxID=200917 RepID=A0A9P0LUM4_ACAOB|nr:unnamed protein product [Acanthoscelides obtectus]CAK1672763.1 Membrane-bound transcription factor site-2 protease [Acanthoscelides obtectus]